MSKKIEIIIPSGLSGQNDIALAYSTEVFDPISKTEYTKVPRKDFRKKCYEMNSKIKKLFSVPLEAFDVEKVKPLSLKKLEQGMKKYFFGEYGIVTEKGKDLKQMYQIKRAITRQNERNQSYHIDSKNKNIIINKHFRSNKKIVKCVNTSVANCNSHKELLRNKKKTLNDNKIENNNNASVLDNSQFSLFQTGIKLIKKPKCNNSEFIANSNVDNNNRDQNRIKLIKNIQLRKYYDNVITQNHRIKGRNIKLDCSNMTSLYKSGYKNSYEALSVDNVIKNNNRNSNSNSNDNNANIVCNKTNNKSTASGDAFTSSNLFQSQQRTNCLNTTYSSGFVNPNQMYTKTNKDSNSNCNSIHKMQLSLSEASNRLIPKLQQMNWAKYNNYHLRSIKTQEDKEKEMDLENLLDMKVDFNNKKSISNEIKLRLNNEENIKFRQAVVKFANEIGKINPITSLKLNDVIKYGYFKQTKTSKYSKLAEARELHESIMNKLRSKMSKHCFHLSKLMFNYNKIKNKIFVS